MCQAFLCFYYAPSTLLSAGHFSALEELRALLLIPFSSFPGGGP